MKHFQATYINGVTGDQETMLMKATNKEEVIHHINYVNEHDRIVPDELINIVEVVYDQDNMVWNEVKEAKAVVNPFKKGDLVKVDTYGIGKIERVFEANEYEEGYLVINISGQSYYRNINTNHEVLDGDIVEKVSVKEYVTYCKEMVKQLNAKSKNTREQASNYNKSVDGIATKRKGKVSVIDGHIIGLVENSISSHHRNLLINAKQLKETKDNYKKEIDFYKQLI